MNNKKYIYNYEEKVWVSKTPAEVFAYLDDHALFSSHMNQSSWMMGGGSMETIIDKDKFQKVGSHIQMKGNILGVKLFLDEVVIERIVPTLKVWETVGTPRLVVVGDYKMTATILPKDGKTLLSVTIGYDLPKTNQWIGKLFSKFYARWCVKLMTDGVRKHFGEN